MKIEHAIEVPEDNSRDLIRATGITPEELEALGYEQMHEWTLGETSTLLEFLKEEIPFRLSEILGLKVSKGKEEEIIREIYENSDCIFNYDLLDELIKQTAIE